MKNHDNCERGMCTICSIKNYGYSAGKVNYYDKFDNYVETDFNGRLVVDFSPKTFEPGEVHWYDIPELVAGIPTWAIGGCV